MAQFEERSDVDQSRDDVTTVQRNLKGRRWRQLFGVLQRKFKPPPPQMEESQQPPVCQTDPAVDRPPQTAVLFSDATTQRTGRREEQASQSYGPHSETSNSSQDAAFVSTITNEDPRIGERRHHGLGVDGGDDPTDNSSPDAVESPAAFPGAASTPMSNLLRAEMGEVGGGMRRRESSGESNAKCSMFGVSEFLALYRSRAFSDPRPTAVQRVATYQLMSERRVSNCDSYTSPSAMSV